MQRPFHPILFGMYPVLALYSLNTALVPAGDVPVPLAVSLVGTCAFWAVLTLILRNPARAAAGASIAVVGFFAEGHLWDFVRQIHDSKKLFESQSDLFGTWLTIWIILVVLGCWKWKKPEHVTKGMNLAGILLAGIPLVSIFASWFSAWRGTDIKEVTSSASKLDVSTRPDIFYVILDGYGRSDALKRVIGFSNDWFVKGLEDRGFFVAKNGRSNYCETELSLASSLNLDYLPTLLPQLSPQWVDRAILDRLIDRNEVSKYLRKLGYRYEAMTTGFPAVHPKSADLWIQYSRGISLFAGVLMSDTPLPATNPLGYISQFESRRLMLQAAVQNMVKASNGGTEPRFIFVHILAPHPPFVFGPNGEPVHQKMPYSIVDGSHFFQNGGTPEMYSGGYAGQAAYLSKLILSAVDQILKKSPKPPVIIIQGDHGSKLKLDQELLEKTDVNECFPNLNAYYVPAKVREKLYDGITPVNSFRLLFNGLFGDTLPKLPDRSYYSGWSSPFRFIEVTDRILPAKTPPAN